MRVAVGVGGVDVCIKQGRTAAGAGLSGGPARTSADLVFGV